MAFGQVQWDVGWGTRDPVSSAAGDATEVMLAQESPRLWSSDGSGEAGWHTWHVHLPFDTRGL